MEATAPAGDTPAGGNYYTQDIIKQRETFLKLSNNRSVRHIHLQRSQPLQQLTRISDPCVIIRYLYLTVV